MLFPQVQEFPQLQELPQVQEPQELQQLLLFPPQHPSRMMIRMIHRQLLLPLFHIFFTSLVCSLGYLMWEEAKSSLTAKIYFMHKKEGISP